jgi:hypothetical protein
VKNQRINSQEEFVSRCSALMDGFQSMNVTENNSKIWCSVIISCLVEIFLQSGDIDTALEHFTNELKSGLDRCKNEEN